MTRDSIATSKKYRCPITSEVMFEPMGLQINGSKQNGDCTHKFERDAIDQWVRKNKNPGQKPTCPCCRRPIAEVVPAAPDYIKELSAAYALPPSSAEEDQDKTSWPEVYFNLDAFVEIAHKNEFHTDFGKRYLSLLEHAPNHLNDKATEGDQKGKSAIEVLASTYSYRQILRRHLRRETTSNGVDHYYFGNAKISPESLQNIEENLLAERTDFLAAEEKAREALIAQEKTYLFNDFIKNRSQFFKLDITTHRPSFEEVNDILQNVLHGQRTKVKDALKHIKETSQALLETVLTSYPTKPIYDYSGRKFENVTILEAAAIVGDVAINDKYQGAVEIISSYFPHIRNGEPERIQQLQAVFPNGVEAHVAEQAKEKNIFDFTAIINAIDKAGTIELMSALEKEGASFTESDSAKTLPNNQLTLTQALNRFREQFSYCVLSEKTPSLQHLLRAFTRYKDKFNQWGAIDEDTKWMKRDLFVRQIIGFVQRFLPALEAQVFARGLYATVENKEKVPESFKFSNGWGYNIYPLTRVCSGLGFDYAVGRGRDVRGGAVGLRAVGTWWWTWLLGKFMSSKNNKLGALMPRQSYHKQESSCVVQ